MRSVTRTCLALMGLALAVPAVAWSADPSDSTCKSCKGRHHKHKAQTHTFRICEKCLAAQQANGGMVMPPPPMAAMPGSTGCTACEASAAGMPMAGMPMMVSNGAPGFAVVGEPAPVGVVQASYQPAGAAAAAPSAPGRAVVGGGREQGSTLPPWAYESPNTLSNPRSNRPHVLSHLLGLRRPESPFAASRERAREKHAAMAYGPYDQHLTEMPASAVYGR